MIEAPDLLPCPLCGGRAEIWQAHHNRPAWVACMGRCCAFVTDTRWTNDEAVAAWNHRAPLPPPGSEGALVAINATGDVRCMMRLGDMPNIADVIETLTEWMDADPSRRLALRSALSNEPGTNRESDTPSDTTGQPG